MVVLTELICCWCKSIKHWSFQNEHDKCGYVHWIQKLTWGEFKEGTEADKFCDVLEHNGHIDGQ